MNVEEGNGIDFERSYPCHKVVFAEEELQHTTELAFGIGSRWMAFVKGIGVLAHVNVGFFFKQFGEAAEY